MRFDPSPLEGFWQIVDPTLLRTRLLESLWYLHAQPPLYNLVVGVGLKAFGSHFASAAHGFQIALGVVIALSLYALLVVFRLGRWWAAALASLFAVSPAMLLFENWLFYEYPVTALLLLAAVAFAWLERRVTAVRSLVVFSLLAALCFTRSSYQIVLPLLALVMTLAVFGGRERRRAILAGAAVPLLLVAALYVKNWALFGIPTTSSWTGMNLMQVAFYGLSAEDQQELLDRGILSPISRVNPFEPLESYKGIVPPARPRGVPVLDDATKPSSGVPNFNNVEYVTISRRYQHDFFDLLVHRPDIYWRGVRIGISNSLTPSSDYYFFLRNREQIGRWNDVFDRAVLWQVHRRGDESHPTGTAWGVVVAYLAALCFGAVELVRVLRRRGGSPTVAFVWLLLAYTAAVLTLGEVAENQRLRFVADPLALALVAALVVRLVPFARGAPGRLAARRS